MVFIEHNDVERQLEKQMTSFLKRAGSKENLESIFGKTINEIKADFWQEIYDAMLVEKYKMIIFVKTIMEHDIH